MELLHVATYSNPSLASLAVLGLEDEGIEVTVIDGWGYHSAATRLWVGDHDYDRALEIVAACPGDGGPGVKQLYWPYLRWLAVGPAAFLGFVGARAVVSALSPELAASRSLVFLLAGPLAGSLAVYFASPRFQWALGLTTLALCLRVAWSM